MNSFFMAIQDLFDTVNPFNTALNGQFSYGLDQDKVIPYATYFGMPGTPAGTWSNDIDDISFQINCCASSPGEAGELLEKGRNLFDGATLAISGYQDVKLQLQMFTPPWFDGDRWISSAEFQGYLIKE